MSVGQKAISFVYINLRHNILNKLASKPIFLIPCKTMEKQNKPYKQLGVELSRIRKRIQESLSEVAGAVEIDDDKLVAYEHGDDRPSEDILQLMITHFNLKDEESDHLWELAGYDDSKPSLLPIVVGDEVYAPQPAIMVLPLDARIVYSDSFQVSINQYGVVMNFVQNTGMNGQQVPVARIGMSLEHARRVAETLQQTIKTASELKQKNLPSGSKDSGKDSKK